MAIEKKCWQIGVRCDGVNARRLSRRSGRFDATTGVQQDRCTVDSRSYPKVVAVIQASWLSMNAPLGIQNIPEKPLELLEIRAVCCLSWNPRTFSRSPAHFYNRKRDPWSFGYQTPDLGDRRSRNNARRIGGREGQLPALAFALSRSLLEAHSLLPESHHGF